MQTVTSKSNGGLTGEAHEANGSTFVAAELIRAEMESLLSDPLFRYSQRASNLLRFIVDRTLRGKTEDLKERIIGIEVFRRAPDYDTSNDSTVRVVANEVRKRLAEYYAKPEHGQQVRIDIPVRSYVAEFRVPEQPATNSEQKQDSTVALEDLAVKHPAPLNPLRFPRRNLLWGASAAAVLALLVWAVWRTLFPPSILERFWSPIVRSSGQVMICIGSPYNPVDDGIPPQSTSAAPSNGQSIPFYNSEQRIYVRMLDANAAEQMSAFLRRQGKDSVLRPTQGSQLSDLRDSPIILYGMFLNEWAEKAGADLHFRFRKESESGHGLRWIEDSSDPSAKKWSVDLSAPYERIDTDYALISRILDRATGHWWIGIAGLTGVGTLAANHIALDQNAMKSIGASLPKGWEQKNVQIVLEIKVVQGSPGATRVITSNAW
jgi:hypothetical protein